MNRTQFKTINALAAVAVIFMFLAGVFTYERYMATDDARTINIAGQQRMLTVEIVEEVMLDHLIHSADVHKHSVAPMVGKLVNRIDTNMDQLRSEIINDETVKAFDAAIKTFEEFLPLFSRIHHLDLLELHEAGEQTVHQFDLLVSAIELEKTNKHMSGILTGVAFWFLSMVSIIALGILSYKALSNTINQSGLTIMEQNQNLIRLAKEAEEAKNVAMAADCAKSEFLANMSHELRTPLNAIIGFSEMMLQGMFGDLNEKYKGYTDDIYTSGKHLLNVIDDILDLAKIDAGKSEVTLITVDPKLTIAASIAIVREKAKEKRIKITEEIIDGQYIHADEIRIKQIMLNLLSNSIKFTDDGGLISIKTELVNGMMRISVTDNGIGMDEKGLKKALMKFGQADGSLTRQHEGTGLGLPLVVELTKLQNGIFDIKSKLGVGTTVSLDFPLCA